MKWGERVKLRPLRPGELEEIDAERRRREAGQARDRRKAPALTEEDAFGLLLGPTGEIGLASIDLGSDARAGRFYAYVSRRRVR